MCDGPTEVILKPDTRKMVDMEQIIREAYEVTSPESLINKGNENRPKAEG